MEPGESPGVGTKTYFVSYARNDPEPGGPDRETIVERFCALTEKRGVHVIRDKTDMIVGDRISNFMRRMAQGDRIIVILSEKYLQSVYCMMELYDIWKDCGADDEEFLKRILVYVQTDAEIDTPLKRGRIALWWKKQHDELHQLVLEGGPGILGEKDHEYYRKINRFVMDVENILQVISDTLRPRNIDELIAYGLENGKLSD